MNEINKHRALWVFGISIAILLYRFLSGVMISQLSVPVLVYPDIDNTYWLFLLSGIPDFLISHPFLAALFDLSLFLLPFLYVVSPNRLWAILFTLFITIYFLSFNVYAAHHYHGLIGVIVMSIPFWFKRTDRFELAWDGARYYFFFLIASAGLWKLFRGSFLAADHFKNVLMSQSTGYLVHNPDTFSASLISHLIARPALAQTVFICMMSIQLVFLLGFFTRKFDRWFMLITILFFIANFFVMRIFSFELLIFLIPLMNWKEWERSGEKTIALLRN